MSDSRREVGTAVKHVARATLALFGMLTLPVVLALPLYFLWPRNHRPSDFFARLDQNADGRLSRPEWDAYYDAHEHVPGELCSGMDFYQADCDADDLLTWAGYHAHRFNGRICPNFPLPPKRGAPPRVAVLRAPRDVDWPTASSTDECLVRSKTVPGGGRLSYYAFYTCCTSLGIKPVECPRLWIELYPSNMSRSR